MSEGDTAATLARVTTGNHQLEEILGGGFPANSLNILMGEPGSGKTILAEHLMFANAEDGGRPILFLTTLSEPLGKVVRYLQQFDFYDESKLASGSIVYDSLGEELAEKGVGVVVPWLKEAITPRKDVESIARDLSRTSHLSPDARWASALPSAQDGLEDASHRGPRRTSRRSSSSTRSRRSMTCRRRRPRCAGCSMTLRAF